MPDIARYVPHQWHSAIIIGLLGVVLFIVLLRMKSVSRYVLGELLKVFFVALTGMTVLMLLVGVGQEAIAPPEILLVHLAHLKQVPVVARVMPMAPGTTTSLLWRVA